MASFDVKRIFTETSANLNVDSGQTTNVFRVVVSGVDDERQAVLLAINAPGVPLLYSLHSFNQWLYVDDISPRAVDDAVKHTYDVVVHYTSPTFEKGFQDPLSVPPEITWTYATSNEPIDRDVDNTPITNSSLESFDPPVTRDISNIVLRVTRNIANIDPIQIAEYMNAVNNDNFLGFAPGLARVTVIEATRARIGTFFYWVQNLEFSIRFDGWKLRILDEGFSTLLGGFNDPTLDANGDYQNITISDPKSEAVLTQPTQLDGNGQKLKPNATPFFKLWTIYPELPFSVFELE